MSTSITQRDLYSMVAKDMEDSVASVKMASFRTGLSSPEHYLRHAFSKEDELAL